MYGEPYDAFDASSRKGTKEYEYDFTRVEPPARLRRWPYRIERMGISVNAVTGKQVKEAMEAANITYVEHHDCSMCGYMTNYSVIDGRLYFDAGCDCRYGGGLEPRSYNEAASWINMQSSEAVRQKLMKKFGMTVEPAPADDAVGLSHG